MFWTPAISVKSPPEFEPTADVAPPPAKPAEVVETVPAAREIATRDAGPPRRRANSGCDKPNDATLTSRGHDRRPALAKRQFEVTQRAFISSDSVGGFEGDARGFSACVAETARMHQRVVVDLDQGEVVEAKDWSDPTFGPGGSRARTDPDGEVAFRSLGSRDIVVTQHTAGPNELVPLAANVDMSTMYRMTMKDDVLRVQVAAWTDKMPSNEIILRDPSNQSIFLCGSAVDEGVSDLLNLFGDRGVPSASADVEIRTDGTGSFTGVRRRGEQEWLTVDRWNTRQMTDGYFESMRDRAVGARDLAHAYLGNGL